MAISTVPFLNENEKVVTVASIALFLHATKRGERGCDA
jgi:hypothetical protein